MTIYVSLIYKIVSVNKAWKHARERWGGESAIATMLRERKSSLQANLIRNYKKSVCLRLDTENTDGESLYSVRLNEPVCLPNKRKRSDPTTKSPVK